MDCKKKYKELVAKIKNAHLYAQTDSTKNVLEGILPELRESEDERIRKVLVELVKCNERCGYFMINNITTSAMLAWLEKQQGEQNPTDNDMIEALRTEYEKGRADAIAEMQKSAWSEDDEKMVNNILTPLAVRYPFNIYQPMYNWLKSLRGRVQSKSQWKPSDGQMNILFKYAEQNNKDGSILTSLYQDLKKLREE